MSAYFPTRSYASLIKLAIQSSESEMETLSGIYKWIVEKFPFYENAGSGWKVRTNLPQSIIPAIYLTFDVSHV